MELKDLLGKLANNLYGMTLKDAHDSQVCIRCQATMEHLQPLSAADRQEYLLSGLCPKCFDTITKDEEGGYCDNCNSYSMDLGRVGPTFAIPEGYLCPKCRGVEDY